MFHEIHAKCQVGIKKMNLWNVKDLPIPPIDTYKAVDTHIDIKHLNKVFQDGKFFFDNEHHMSAEFAVMSRIVYRTKQKFRSGKDFKALVKIHRALDNYFKTNISSDLQNFMDLIPFTYKKETYLPNKNILDYILVRLQGLVKLLERLVETCKITAYLFERRLHTGHFWKIGLIIFSIVSRIYVLAKYNAKFICGFYAKAYPFSQQLRNSGRNWLPENYILPTDLKKWMNVDWLDIDEELQIIEPSDLSRITQYFDLIEDDDIQFCDEYVMVDDDEELDFTDSLKNDSNIYKQNMNFMRGFYTDEDVGEVIEINDKSLLPNENEAVQVDVGEVIELDESLLLNENDSLKRIICNDSEVKDSNNIDFGEVIEYNEHNEQCSLGSPLLDFKENENTTLHENLDYQNGKDSCEIISLPDETTRPDIQNTRNSSPKMFSTKGEDIIELDKDVEILDVPTQCKIQKKKKKTIKRKNKLKNNNIEAFKQSYFLENTNGKNKDRITSTFNSGASKILDESDSENIIILSDSSLLHDDVPNTKKKKAKNKNRKKIDNSLTLKSSKRDTFTNAMDVIDLCSNEIIKKKKGDKKLKIGQSNLISSTPIRSEFQCSSGVKRKCDVFSKPPCKKIKSGQTNASEPTQIRTKKDKTVKINQFTSIMQHNSSTTKISQNATKITNQINGVHKRKKDKFKKKNMKRLSNIQESSDIAKKTHYNTNELNTPQNARKRRRKYRYFL